MLAGNNEPATQAPGTKEIIHGVPGYRAGGATGTMSSVYGATNVAAAVLRKYVLPIDCEVVGLAFANTMGGSASGNVTGEQNASTAPSTVNHRGLLCKTGALTTQYLLYSNPDAADLDLNLAVNTTGDLRLNKTLHALSGETIQAQMTYEYTADTDVTYRQFAYNAVASEAEERIAYTSVASARTQMNSTSWNPAGTARTTINSLTTTSAPAGIILRVKASQPHFAIWGTSREAGQDTTNSHMCPWLSTTVPHTGYWQMALKTAGYTGINFAMASARAEFDMADAMSSIRRSLMRGVTHVVIGHNQNDLANITLSAFQTILLRQYRYFKSLGMTVILCTMDPWVQASTSVSNALDDYSGQVAGQTISLASAGTETKRLAYNAWVRGPRGATTASGDGTTRLEQVCDVVVDTAVAVEHATNAGFWKSAELLYNTTTAGAGHTTSVVVASAALSGGANSLFEQLIRTKTAADADIWSIVRGNGSTTSITASQVFSSSGTPGNAKALEIWNTYTNDGIHASHFGNLAKSAVCATYLAGI